MTDISYNINVTYDGTNYKFTGSDERGSFYDVPVVKYNFYFKTDRLIRFTLDNNVEFVISDFSNGLVDQTPNQNQIIEITSNRYVFYKFGPTVSDSSGIIEIFSSSISTKEELISILNKKRNIVRDPSIRSDLQIFNTDKRRFLGNYNYIISDQSKLITDSSGIVDDMIIQSITSDIHLVTDGSNNKIHFWCGETIVEEDLVIKGNLKMNFNKANFNTTDTCFNSLNILSNSGLRINNQEVPTKNYVDSSFTRLDDLNKGFDVSFDNIDVSGSLIIDNIDSYTQNQGVRIENILLKNGNIGLGLTTDPSHVIDASGDIKLTGSLKGPNEFFIKPLHTDTSGTVVIDGNL